MGKVKNTPDKQHHAAQSNTPLNSINLIIVSKQADAVQSAELVGKNGTKQT